MLRDNKYSSQEKEDLHPDQGKAKFPGGEWGKSSEFHFDQAEKADRSEADQEWNKNRHESSTEYNRSRFAEPYTGGQFSRSQYGTGSNYSHDYSMQERSFSGVGPKGYKRSDERIREEVCEALYRSPFVDASDIEVSVTDGCVLLQGTVDSRNAKKEAENCIENLSGVEDVQNELRLYKGDYDAEKKHGKDSLSQ